MKFEPENLYLLIMSAQSISDTEKNRLINKLNSEGYTQELASELDPIFEKEEERLGNFIEVKKQELDKAKKDLKVEEGRARPELEALAEATKQDFESINGEYGRRVDNEIEGPFYKEIEGLKKSDEENQIAAIKSKLHKK